MRQFCSYGPVDCKAHFCVQRKALIAKGVQQLIGSPEEKSGHYFTIWAPRQTGKTWLMRQIKQEILQQYPDEFTVFNFSLGKLRGMSFTEKQAEFPLAFGRLIKRSLPEQPDVKNWDDFYQLFSRTEGLWDRPLILLIDEVDTLPLALIDLMVAQFRELYLERENNWLHGLALIGVRAVLGIESQRGSPFNIQRALKVPNLTPEEVKDLYRQYQEESGQQIEVAVVDKIYESTKGQPGLVSWFGELLTEKYNPGTNQIIGMETWEDLWEKARFVEPNNTVMNLIAKAQVPEYQHFLTKLFTNNLVPFSFHRPLCSYLYLHGIIKPVSIRQPNGKRSEICRFSSPFIQDCLYYALIDEIVSDDTPILPLQPLDDLADVFAGTGNHKGLAGNHKGLPLLNLPALLTRYKDYLARL
ncbi:MAG: AAA-like domain-containing protein, partial [Pseudomonadota bacterium]